MAEAERIPALDPARLFRALAEHQLEYVLIGALAARFSGYPLLTSDADITPARTPENLERLAKALRALDAKVYTDSVPEGLPFDCSAPMLARAEGWHLVTAAGRLDILFSPAGSNGYADLAQSSETFDVNDVPVVVASLPAIIKMKEAAGRPKDLQAVAILKAMIERDARRK